MGLVAGSEEVLYFFDTAARLHAGSYAAEGFPVTEER
jgi:hypothetical protein